MELIIYPIGEHNIAELKAEEVAISEVQDALNLIANADYQGASSVIIRKENLCPEFFDLKTQIAGEILQKVSNYRKRLAIVGDFTGYNSKSLNDFIRESNRMGRVIFVETLEEAQRRLTT